MLVKKAIMGLFYTATRKESIDDRNEIFLKRIMPAMQNAGFERSPFNDWFGRDNLQNFNYVFCRLNTQQHLEIIWIYISRGDKFIKVFLNIFELTPPLKSLDQVDGFDCLQYWLPPNSASIMRLRSDEYKGLRLFRTRHKLKSYYTKRGFKNSVDKLGKLIEKDISDIDHFVKCWYELHTPMKTDWNGKGIVETA